MIRLRVNVGTVYSESYGYDGFNRVSSVSRVISGRSYATSYQYNTASQATRMSYPSGRAINISHDSLGRIAAISNNADGTNYLSAVTYNGAGQVSGWKLGSNIVETMSYSADRMQMIGQKVTQNGAVRMSLGYSYQGQAGQNGAGSTAGNTGQMMSESGSLDGHSESASYSYDLQGRLATSTQTTGGVSAQRRYSYDRWGNRTAVWDATTGGSLIQSVSLQQAGGAPTNRIESVTSGGVTASYSYDAAGNVISDGQHSYQYDAQNRLVSVDAAATASYGYDHHNRRVKKVAAAATTHYIWSGQQVIAEHDGISGAVSREHIYVGSRMIARESGAGREYLLYDRLSVRAVIADGQGSITGRQSHLPYGEQVAAAGAQEKHRFTSYERDSETGLDYAVNRVYSPAVGRFLQADPYRASGGANDPQSWNRYAYAQNEPVNRVDPLGLRYCIVYRSEWGGPIVGVGSCYSDGPGGPFGGEVVSGPAGPIQISKHFKFEYTCNENALAVMTELKRRFTELASYRAENGSFISFDRVPIINNAVIGITTLLVIPGEPVDRPSTARFHVQVIRDLPASWTFGTQSDHVFFPGTIKFSTSDISEGRIKFSIKLEGELNGIAGWVGFYAGGGKFEDEVWQNLGKKVKEEICDK